MSTGNGSRSIATPPKHSSVGRNSLNSDGLGSESKKNFGSGGGKNIQVIYNGKIVTPQALIPRKINYQSSSTANRLKNKYGIKKIQETLDEGSETKEEGEVDIDKVDEFNEMNKMSDASSSSHSESKQASDDEHKYLEREREKERQKEREREAPVTVVLRETETLTLFCLNSLVFVTPAASEEEKEKEAEKDAEREREREQVERENARFADVRVKCAPSSECLGMRGSQTTSYNGQKSTECSSASTACADKQSFAAAYDITDSLAALPLHSLAGGTERAEDLSPRENHALPLPQSSSSSPTVAQFVSDSVRTSLLSPGSLLDMHITKKAVNAPVTKNKKTDRKSGLGGASGVNVASMAGASGFDLVGSLSMAGPASGSKAHNTSGSRPNHSLAMRARGDSGGGKDARTRDSRAVQSTNSSGDPDNASPGVALPTEYTFTAEPGDDEDFDCNEDLIMKSKGKQIMASESLKMKLQMMERAVLQNIYYSKQIDYRETPSISKENMGCSRRSLISERGSIAKGDSIKNLLDKFQNRNLFSSSNSLTSVTSIKAIEKTKRIFQFRCPSIVRDRVVTCLVYNHLDPSLLAVGYGFSEISPKTLDNGRGLVLFWSPRNPHYPEKILHTKHGVSALDFSKSSPFVLAVGMQNGDLSVFDMSRDTWQNPIEQSNGMAGSHTEVICQAKWVSRGGAVQSGETHEDLITISTDGRILQWSLKKGLTVASLMSLKRTTSGEGWVSRMSSGLCFDFASDDPSTYMAGTEDGGLHRCSVSYNEQVLESYAGHHGPLYRICFSPFNPSLFLTCSADWNIGLYRVSHNAPLNVMHASNQDSVINDISWCPGNSTVFAAVTENSRIQIWDLSMSRSEPINIIDCSLLPDDELSSFEEETLGPATVELTQKQLAKVLANVGLNNDKLKKDVVESPVMKLLDNLRDTRHDAGTRRALSCLSFGRGSATIAVGDSGGCVSVFKVNEPVLVDCKTTTDQQKLLLEDAVLSLGQPTSVSGIVKKKTKDNTNGNGSPIKQNVKAQSNKLRRASSKPMSYDDAKPE